MVLTLTVPPSAR